MMSDSYDDENVGKKKVDLDSLTIQNLMNTENGRNLMWRWLSSMHVFDSVFDADPIQHAYLAGSREKGLMIDRELKEAAPDRYLKMLKENI